MPRNLAFVVALAACLASRPHVGVLFAAAPETPQTQQAQQPPQTPQTPAPRPTFRSTIDTVSVDVIVLDKQGRPVTDLTAADFEIRESKKPQRIDTFKFIDVEAAPESRPTTHREITSIEDQRREAGRDDTRVIVIFLDDYHVRRGNAMRVREQLATFVSRLSPNDMVAIVYPLTPVVAMTFSRNHDGTAAALMQFDGRKYDYTPRNAYEERYQFQPPELQERMRNDLTMSAIEQVCVVMGSLKQGRKTLLYVSEGISGSLPQGVATQGPLGGRTPVARPPDNAMEERLAFFASTEVLSRMRLVWAAAARGNTAVYTLDPRGLATGEFDINDNVSSDIDRRVLNESTDMLRTLAGETDGRSIVGRNNPLPELQQMVRDTSAYYLIGYTSSEAPRDGKFHEIDVRVNRRDVDVRARKGYWAYTLEEAERMTAPPKPEAPADVRRALESLSSADETTLRRRRLNVWLGATPVAAAGPSPMRSEVTLAWESLAARGEAGEAIDRVDVVATASDGAVVFQQTVGKTDPLGRVAGRATFVAPAGPLRLRLTGLSLSGNRVEAVDESFDVPDFGGTALLVSAPAVYRGRTARDMQSIRAAAAPVPAVGRAFSRTERLLLRFGARAGSVSAPELTARILNRLGEEIASLAAPTAVTEGRYEAQVILAALPPGDYLVELAAKAGDQTARTLLAIRVTG